MTIIDKIENMPTEFVDENGNKGFLEFKRGNNLGLNHKPSWIICYMNNGTVIKQFEEKQFEEVVIIAFEWFRKNKPELLNERKRRE